jgi:hypothetical protein
MLGRRVEVYLRYFFLVLYNNFKRLALFVLIFIISVLIFILQCAVIQILDYAFNRYQYVLDGSL